MESISKSNAWLEHPHKTKLFDFETPNLGEAYDCPDCNGTGFDFKECHRCTTCNGTGKSQNAQKTSCKK